MLQEHIRGYKQKHLLDLIINFKSPLSILNLFSLLWFSHVTLIINNYIIQYNAVKRTCMSDLLCNTDRCVTI